MALAAATVIDALTARLVPQATLGGRVKNSRAWPWSEAELPACRVFAADEAVQIAALEPLNEHALSVDVQYTTRAVDDLDDAMHALAAAGLTLLFAPPVPYQLTLSGISRSLASEGEAAVGQITLQVQCRFYVDPAVPETIHS